MGSDKTKVEIKYKFAAYVHVCEFVCVFCCNKNNGWLLKENEDNLTTRPSLYLSLEGKTTIGGGCTVSLRQRKALTLRTWDMGDNHHRQRQ